MILKLRTSPMITKIQSKPQLKHKEYKRRPSLTPAATYTILSTPDSFSQIGSRAPYIHYPCKLRELLHQMYSIPHTVSPMQKAMHRTNILLNQKNNTILS